MASATDSGFSLTVFAQTVLEGGLWATLLQTLLTGIYTMIYIQTIIPLLRTGHEKVYVTVLTLIFMVITVNMAVFWKMLREALILNNNNRFTMAQELFTTSVMERVVMSLTARGAIVLADIIMAWRCYTLWARSKILLLIFSLFVTAEFVLLVKLTLPSVSTADLKVGVPAFYFLSSAVTILATVLIILRIVFFVKRSEGGLRVGDSYMLIIAVVVESGLVYSASLMAASIFYVNVKAGFSVRAVKLAEGLLIWEQALVPVTGIATTLIAFRVATGRARDGSTVSRSKPTSTLQFEGMGTRTQRSGAERNSLTFSLGEHSDSNGTKVNGVDTRVSLLPPLNQTTTSTRRANREDEARCEPPQWSV